MRLSRLLATAALPAALALAGCAGSSNNRSAVTTTTTTTTPSGFPAQIAYVGNAGGGSSNTVRAYSIAAGSSPTSAANVTLLSSSPTTSNGTPEALALDPARHYLFVVANDDNQYLEAFQVNANGSLATAPAAGLVISNPAHDNAEIAVAAPTGAPSGTEYVYVATSATGQLNAYRFNTTTLTLTAFTPNVSGTDVPYSLTTDTAGTHLYSGGGSGHPAVTPYVISATDGTLTAEAQEEAGTTGPVLVTNDPAASAVYAYDVGAKILYAYSTAGGTLTSENYVSTPGAGNDLAIAPNGSAVYLSNGTGGTVTGSAIGSGGSLGAPTTTGAITGTDLLGVLVDATSRYVLTVDQNSDSVLAYPITAPGVLGTPIPTPLTGTTPVSVLFVPVATPL